MLYKSDKTVTENKFNRPSPPQTAYLNFSHLSLVMRRWGASTFPSSLRDVSKRIHIRPKRIINDFKLAVRKLCYFCAICFNSLHCVFEYHSAIADITVVISSAPLETLKPRCFLCRLTAFVKLDGSDIMRSTIAVASCFSYTEMNE